MAATEFTKFGNGFRFEVQPTWTPAALFELQATDPKNSRNAGLWQGIVRETMDGSRTSFNGMNYDELRNLKDWPQGREIAKQYLCDLSNLPVAQSIRRVRCWREDGDEFDRDRFDSGQLDCWSVRRRQSFAAARPGIIKITTSIGGNASVMASDLVWTGTAASVLVDRLEDAGYRCEVVGIHACVTTYCSAPNDRKLGLISQVTLKAADEPMDLDRMLMVCSCSGFFRWHLFRATLDSTENINDSLGSFIEPPTELHGDIHLPQVRSLEDAQRVLNQIIEKFGVEAAA